ncbi:MAG: 1-acyl-sn-glycerol-3-phosphate acyltransferase [Verrucomicrobia bacterium]|nr:1-acyl-sn-glycerol-3-phosphate acyltransferase [Verrucomicrobiota bacterium]
MVDTRPMKDSPLVKAFAEQESYETQADRHINLLDRMFWWSDAWFYARLFQVIFGAFLKTRLFGYNYRHWANDSLFILAIVENCRVPVRVEGLKHLRGLKEPVVIVSNHMGMLETLFAGGITIPSGIKLNTVVKLSLVHYPVFGPVLGALDPITVGRTDPKEDLVHVLKKGAESIRQGRSVLLFPQATRSPVFGPARFNTLGIKLARNTGSRVMPLAVKTDFLGIGKRVRDLGKISRDKPVFFRFGEPMALQGNGRETHEKTVQFISGCLREWGGVVEEPAVCKDDNVEVKEKTI